MHYMSPEQIGEEAQRDAEEEEAFYAEREREYEEAEQQRQVELDRRFDEGFALYEERLKDEAHADRCDP
jgi:hypothetical protein